MSIASHMWKEMRVCSILCGMDAVGRAVALRPHSIRPFDRDPDAWKARELHRPSLRQASGLPRS